MLSTIHIFGHCLHFPSNWQQHFGPGEIFNTCRWASEKRPLKREVLGLIGGDVFALSRSDWSVFSVRPDVLLSLLLAGLVQLGNGLQCSLFVHLCQAKIQKKLSSTSCHFGNLRLLGKIILILRLRRPPQVTDLQPVNLLVFVKMEF